MFAQRCRRNPSLRSLMLSARNWRYPQRVAAELLKEYRTLFNIWLLGDRVDYISYGGDPAKTYDRYMRRFCFSN